MDLLKFIPIKLNFFLIIGILTGKIFDFSIVFATIITLIGLVILAFLFKKSHRKKSLYFGCCALLTMICIGILAVSLWKPKNWKSHYSHFENQNLNSYSIKIQEVLKSTKYNHQYLATVQKLNGQSTSGKILLSTPNDIQYTPFKVDYSLLAIGQLKEIQAPLNPHQFDFKSYMERQGVYHQLRIDKNSYSLTKFYSPSVYGIASKLRIKIISKLREANFPKEELAIVQALLLGQRNDISDDTYINYKNAGAVHILAVSGLHIGIILLVLQFLLRPLEFLPKGKELKLALIVLILWGFALLAGFSSSVVRAVAMFSFVAYALYLNRPNNTFNILALSMFFILLLINPMLLFQAGFQMSYAAVIAIVWIYPLLQKLWFPKPFIIKKIWQLFSVSVAAQLGVLPISLFYFHQFPGLFFISNLVIVPFLGILLGIGILVICLAMLNILPEFLIIAYSKLIQLMNSSIAWIAQKDTFLFKNISFDSVQLMLCYTVIISFLILVVELKFKRIVLFLSTVLVFQIYTLGSAHLSHQKNELLLAHQTKNTILFDKNGEHLKLFARHKEATKRLVSNYQVAERIHLVTHDSVRNSYTWFDKKIKIIDSLGILPKEKNVDFLILTQSPKINLDRVLDSLQPKNIIADGSNYKNLIERWQKSCLKKELPFHYTGEKGAYYFE